MCWRALLTASKAHRPRRVHACGCPTYTCTAPPTRAVLLALAERRHCGGAMHIARPEGEKEYRHVCTDCGTVEYFNPKMVVGCIVTHPGPGPDAGKLLLCRLVGLRLG